MPVIIRSSESTHIPAGTLISDKLPVPYKTALIIYHGNIYLVLFAEM